MNALWARSRRNNDFSAFLMDFFGEFPDLYPRVGSGAGSALVALVGARARCETHVKLWEVSVSRSLSRAVELRAEVLSKAEPEPEAL